MSTRINVTAMLAALVVAGWSAAASADATIGSLNTLGNGNTMGLRLFAQTFQVPAGETGIRSASLVLVNEQGVTSGQFSIYTYDSGTLTPLYSTPLTLNPGAEQVLEFFPNIPLIPGPTYAIGVDWGSGQLTGTYYSSNYYGNGFMLLQSVEPIPTQFTAYDMAFEVEFGSIPEPASVALLTLAFTSLLTRRR
jgi:hypothetical protein